MSSENSTDNEITNESSVGAAGVSKETIQNVDAKTETAGAAEKSSLKKNTGTTVMRISGKSSRASEKKWSYGSDRKGGRKAKKKKKLSERSVVCIVFIVIFTLVAALDVANHLTTASASTPIMDGASFDGTDFDFSDIDSSDFDSSDFQGMMPGSSGSDSSDPDSADGDSLDAAGTENGFGRKGSGGGMPGSSDSDVDPSDMDSADFDSDSMPSGGGSFMGGSGSDMSFPGSSDSDDTEPSDSTDTTETTSSTQRVVANIRSALNTAWLPILAVCVLGDAAAVAWMVLGIRKEQKAEAERRQAETERVNAVRAKKGLPPVEAGEKNGEKKEADGSTASQRKRRKNRKIWRVAMALLLIVVIVVAAFPSLYNSQAQTTTLVMVEETLNGTAETGTIATTLSGSGTLTAEDAVEQTVPSTVTVDEYYVQNGDMVEEGDLIATVNLTSVQLAIQELQEDLDALDADLAEEAETTYETSFTAVASGRVKVIYAEEDVSVIDTMNEYDALMLISVDGLMQAEVTAADDTTIGDSVTVTLSDGTEVTGRVANVEDGTATVTLSDEEAAYGDEVTVTDADGNDMGSDTLTIHSELKVTNYYGTVESISVSVDDEVAAGDELLVLTDVGTTAEYQSLLTQRADLEEQMEELTALMQDNHIYAETTGIVSGIDDDATIVTADAVEDTSDNDSENGDTSEGDSEDEDTSDSDSDDADGDDGENTASIESNSTVNTAFVGDDSTADTTAVSAGSLISATTLPADAGTTALRSTTAGGVSYAYTLSTASATGTDASGSDADEDSSQGSSSDGRTDASAGSSGSGSASDSSSGSSSGSSSSSLISGEFKTVTSGLGSLDSLVSTNTDADSSLGSADRSSSDSSGLAGTVGTADDFSSATGGTDSADASDLLSALTGTDSTDDTGSSSYSDSDYEALLAALEDAQSSGTDGTDTVEETAATYSVSTTTVVSITPTDTMTISISIDELDILSVETGQTAEITLDALTGQSFTGTVTSIDLSGTNSGGSTKYTAKITLERTSQMLTGMNATARITLAETEDILVIPVAAIYEEGNKSYVYTTYDEETDTLGGLTEVETGVSDGTNVEITSGLSEGDTYYYVYTENITYSVETSGNFLTDLFGN